MRRCGGTPPYRLGQQIRQSYVGIVQTRLDGSNRNVQRGGNLLDGLVGEIAQHDHFPKRRRERSYCIRNFIVSILRFRCRTGRLLLQVLRRSPRKVQAQGCMR